MHSTCGDERENAKILIYAMPWVLWLETRYDDGMNVHGRKERMG